MGAGAVPQYKVQRAKFPGRNYYLDFAIPSKMIALECDGKAYHSTPAQLRYDQKRQKELEDMGWRIIRFTGSQIVTNITGCEKELTALLKGK